MRVLGFINAFDELAEADPRLGRRVANRGLAAALMEHSSVDELHFFLPFFGAVKPFEEAYGPWLGRGGGDRVRLLPAMALYGAVQQADYLAIHAAELDRYFPELCHLRNRLARTPFPVTCTPHTLCYWSTQVRNLYKVLPGPRAYDSIFCTSQAARIHLEQSFAGMAEGLRDLGLAKAGYAGRLDISPLGVRTADFGAIDQALAQAQLGLSPGVFTVLCLGRLTFSDKFDLAPLVGAMALLNRRVPARLVLAGAEHQGYGRSLVELGRSLGLEGRVTLLADFPSSLKPAILAAADVFVSPADNLQETFGLALVEAMAAGLPVVAGDFSGYRDLVKDGVTGFLLPSLGPGAFGPLDALYPVLAEHVGALQVAQRTALDLEALVDRLAVLANDRELRLAMGRAGRQRALSRFDWAVVVRGMEALWDELKAQALAAGPAGPQGLEPDVMGYGLGRAFGHFVSGGLDPEDKLRHGPLAREFGQGLWARQPHQDLAGAMGAQAMEAVLAALERLGGQAGPRQIGAEMGAGLPVYQVEHLLLWGLKYGLLAKV